MSKPKRRELDAVSKLPVLSESEVKTLYQILGVLGFDFGTIALFMEKSEAEVRMLFRLDASNSAKPTSTFLTGSDLAWWCDLVHLRPGVVQQRLNFDESNVPLTKRGWSSIRVPSSWSGPPVFATKGAVYEGRTFVELSGLVTLPASAITHTAVLGQMAEGKYPVRLPQLRALLCAIEGAAIDHPKVEVIRNALAQFPKGVRTPEEVLDALTHAETIESQEETTSIPTEESMHVIIIDRFRAEMARRGLQSALCQLHESSGPIRQLCQHRSIDLGGEVLPGHFEEIVGSAEFKIAAATLPQLTTPLRELGEWLAAERREEAERATAKKFASSQTTRALPMPAASTPTPTPPAAPPVVKRATAVPPARHVSPLVQPEVMREVEPPPETRLPRRVWVEVDEFGVGWDQERHQVIIGAISIPLVPISDPRLGEAVRTVSQRVYDTLYAVFRARGLDWQYFLPHLRVQREWFSNLLTSQSQLTSTILKHIIEGLRQHYQLDLTPAQLFGLSPLPSLAAEAVAGVGVEKREEYLFPLGDTRAGYRFASLLVKYRAVWFWFRRVYGVTDEHVAKIEKGEIGVPVAVHHVLMWKVRERIAGSEAVVIPRAYQWFLNQPQSKPVVDGQFVLDETAIPNQNWLDQ